MRNPHLWVPTKFEPTSHGHRASSDPARLWPASRLVASIQLAHYEPLLREHARGVLLDLGCGHVPLYGVYRDLVSETVCVDWAQSRHANPLLDLEADLNAPLPLADAAFDTVLMTDVLEHIAEPQQLLGEVGRVLRPGGKLLLTVPFLYWIHEQPHDYYRYTEFALRRLCERAGLRVHTLHAYGGAPEVLLDIVGKNVAFSPLLLRLHQRIGNLLLSSGVGRRATRTTATTFPLGYCLVACKDV